MKHQNKILESLKITKCQNLYISHWEEHLLLLQRLASLVYLNMSQMPWAVVHSQKIPKLLIFPNIKLFTKMSAHMCRNINLKDNSLKEMIPLDVIAHSCDSSTQEVEEAEGWPRVWGQFGLCRQTKASPGCMVRSCLKPLKNVEQGKHGQRERKREGDGEGKRGRDREGGKERREGEGREEKTP